MVPAIAEWPPSTSMITPGDRAAYNPNNIKFSFFKFSISLTTCCPPQFAQIRTDRGSDDNPLWAIFDGVSEGPVVDKWQSYFDVYHRYRGQQLLWCSHDWIPPAACR